MNNQVACSGVEMAPFDAYSRAVIDVVERVIRPSSPFFYPRGRFVASSSKRAAAIARTRRRCSASAVGTSEGLVLTGPSCGRAAGAGTHRCGITADGQELRARLAGRRSGHRSGTAASRRVAGSRWRRRAGRPGERRRGWSLSPSATARLESTASAGVVSKLGRSLRSRNWSADRRRDPDRRGAQSRQFRGWCRPGGEVIGINTAVIMGAQGICFGGRRQHRKVCTRRVGAARRRVRRAFIGIAAQNRSRCRRGVPSRMEA